MGAKPIFIIRFPIDHIGEMAEERSSIFEALQEKIKDYHVLGLIDCSVEKIEFECHNSDHTKLQFSKLKERAMEVLENTEKYLAEQKDIQSEVFEKLIKGGSKKR